MYLYINFKFLTKKKAKNFHETFKFLHLTINRKKQLNNKALYQSPHKYKTYKMCFELGIITVHHQPKYICVCMGQCQKWTENVILYLKIKKGNKDRPLWWNLKWQCHLIVKEMYHCLVILDKGEKESWLLKNTIKNRSA